MVEPDYPDMSIARQYRLPDITRSNYYYEGLIDQAEWATDLTSGCQEVLFIWWQSWICTPGRF